MSPLNLPRLGHQLTKTFATYDDVFLLMLMFS